MHRTAVFLTLLLFLISGLALADQIKTEKVPVPDMPSFIGYVPGQLIVQYNSPLDKGTVSRSASGNLSVGISSLDAIAERYEVNDMRQLFNGAQPKVINGQLLDLSRHFVVNFDPSADLDEVYQAYLNDPNIESVEKNGIHSMYATPNDGYFSYQWYHTQASDHDIDSPEAWDIQTGSDALIIADLDSGTRYFHPDLGGANASYSNPGASRGNMWINNAELNGSSGVDDDGNGYVDDWIGWDFIDGVSNCWSGEDCNTEDNDPRDFNGHGTHTAGIIGMLTNDGYGMAGTAGGWGNGSQAEYGNGVKVMALRMGYSYNYLGQEYGVVMMDAAAAAFYYAANNGAKIASCSWGSSNSGGIGAAADYFIANGGIIVVAAGNAGAEVSPDYLGSRGDCIDVGATDDTDDGASFTTYGTWVDICAPGDNIYSTYHDHTDPSTNYWASMGGTSMATPMVAGVTGLIWSQNPTWTASQVKSQLFSSVDDIDAYLSSKYIGKMGVGRINAYNAVNTGTPPPVAAFTGSPTTGCAPLTVNFTDQTTGDVTSWNWNFGDGVGTSSAQNPSYEYTSGGTYTVTLTATGPGGSDDEIKASYITVNVAPTAGFSGSPTTGTAPLTVAFTDASTGATSWSWDFGDGVGTSTAQNPGYTYNNAGTYTVTLTATNACGSDQDIKTGYITVDPCVAPVADFSGLPTSGTEPLTVDFTDLSINSPSSWSWNFGDGAGTSTAQNPSYTYNNTGTYTVTLTATNPCGSDGLTKIDYITVDPSMLEQARALSDIPVTGSVSGNYTNTYASDDSYEVITEVQYTGHPRKTYSYLEHKWNFNVGGSGDVTFYLEAYRPANGDGDDFIFAYSTDDVVYSDLVTVASATEQVYTASLPTGTNGTVYIRVVDTDRAWGNLSLDSINIDNMYIEFSSAPAPPITDFAGSPTSGAVPLTVNFTDLSTGSPTSWSWDFGDGVGTSTARNPSYTYTATGTYTVSLTATNTYGSDAEVKTGYITVTDVGATMYVFDMVVGRGKSGPNYFGTCTVIIYDNLNQAVSGATVYVTAIGPTGGTYSGTTAADGTVDFQTGGMKKPPGEWCFEVTNVTYATLTYDAGSNNVTQSCESGDVYGMGDPTLLSALPTEFGLKQNHPNPFNPVTSISFNLPYTTYTKLVVYNIMGQVEATLVDRRLEAGYHSVTWNASQVASGMYFYRLETSEFVSTKKMILVK